MKTPKLLRLILFLFVAAILALPLSAQETRSMKKFPCPYCDMVNLAMNKFCGTCGSKLPALSFTVNLDTGSEFDDEFDFQLPSATEALVGAGLFTGTIGFFAGGFVGAEIDRAGSDDYEEWDGLYGFVVGAPIGESLLLPVGIHLANGRRGNFPLSLLASIGIAGAGIAVAAAAQEPAILLSIPILQLTACTAIEQSTGRSRQWQ